MFKWLRRKKEVEQTSPLAALGIRKGGMYSGLTFLPFNPRMGDGIKANTSTKKCNACGGLIYDYWKGKEYVEMCESCQYINDAGMKLETNA